MCFVRWQLGLHIHPDWDPSHGAFRAALEGISKSGMMVHLVLMVMSYNCGYGEWRDGTRHEQINHSVKDSVATLTPRQRLDVPKLADEACS